MTTPTDTDRAVAPPSQLARIIALSTLQNAAADLTDLDPILNEALTDASLEQAGILLRRIDAAQQRLATLAEMTVRRMAVLTQVNGVFPIGGGLVVERTGGRSSGKRKAWDRPRLVPLAAKKAAALAASHTLDAQLLVVAEQAATLALGCVPSDWRLPGLRALGLDPERYSDEATSATKIVVRPADTTADETA